MAVPPMLMVAPRGRVKAAMSLRAPSFSEHSRFRGRVPTEEALEKADPKVLDEIDTLEQEYDRVCEKHADLWDKVDEAYFDLPDDYDFDNYDEAAFIRSLSFLTDAEKDALIADYNRLVELDNQLCKLYDTIWGNTGCESGICPL